MSNEANRLALLRLVARHRSEFEQYVLEERRNIAVRTSTDEPDMPEWLALITEDSA